MARPTAIYYGEDAGDTYYFWQWIGVDLTEPRIHRRSAEQMLETISRLERALPGGSAGDNDSPADIVTTLKSGAFSDRDTELKLARELSDLLLPVEFAREIVELSTRSGAPVLLRILPSPSSARVPWELLTIVVDGAEPHEHRLIEFADIALDPPAGIHAGRSQKPDDWSPEHTTRPAVYVIDPDTAVEGFVLRSDQSKVFRAAATGPWMPANPEPHGILTRQRLSELLTSAERPSRLVFVGHVASADSQPGATSMLLSDGPRMYGIADVITRGGRLNRPFSAFDAVEGTLNSQQRARKLSDGTGPLALTDAEWPTRDRAEREGAKIWPMPARVALIACNSGRDIGHPEPFGLAIAFINAGAGLVTSTRWTLPTDEAMSRAGQPPDVEPLLRMALVVDGALAQEEPEHVLAEWQRSELEIWKHQTPGDLSHSPIIWAALSTYLAPRKELRDVSGRLQRESSDP